MHTRQSCDSKHSCLLYYITCAWSFVHLLLVASDQAGNKTILVVNSNNNRKQCYMRETTLYTIQIRFNRFLTEDRPSKLSVGLDKSLCSCLFCARVVITLTGLG